MSNAIMTRVAGATKILAAAAALSAATGAIAADHDAVSGYWVSENQSQVLEIKPCTEGSSRMCGDVVWKQGATDATNETFLKGFRLVRGIYTKGKVIDPSSGKKKDGRFQLEENGSLKVSTCKRRLCRHEMWQRPAADMAQLPAEFRGAGL